MFGFSTPTVFSRIAPRNATTRTALAVAAASAALLIIGSAAQAQSCSGGYYMVKGEIPVRCDTRAMLSPATSAPVQAGSIARTEFPPNAARPSHAATAPATASANSTAACTNGMRYVDTAANGWTLPIPCS